MNPVEFIPGSKTERVLKAFVAGPCDYNKIEAETQFDRDLIMNVSMRLVHRGYLERAGAGRPVQFQLTAQGAPKLSLDDAKEAEIDEEDTLPVLEAAVRSRPLLQKCWPVEPCYFAESGAAAREAAEGRLG